jgi:hypothetical protein
MNFIVLLSLLLVKPLLAKPASCEEHVPIFRKQLTEKEFEKAVVWINCDVQPAKTVFKLGSSLMSPHTLNADAYIAFVDAAPEYNWSHEVAYLFVGILDEKEIKSENLWKVVADRYSGFPIKLFEVGSNKKLIHVGAKVPGWKVPKEKIWP